MKSVLLLLAATSASAVNVTTWHVVWTGGQSNSVGTNSQTSGYPSWPTTSRIQMFCWPMTPRSKCEEGTFTPAAVPLYGEKNVGFSQTFANLLLKTLPEDHGIVVLNTGVNGAGFHANQWTAPNGTLAVRSVTGMKALANALPAALGGKYVQHAMLWHQGEADAGDNRQLFNASYCQYLVNDLSVLVDFLRAGFPGASAGTPFVDGGLLPYWVHKETLPLSADGQPATQGVMSAIYGLNTSRPCTGTADSLIFPDYIPGTNTPDGDPDCRSGIHGDVIHFNATQATLMGYQYWRAYGRAVKVSSVVASAKTKACGAATARATKCVVPGVDQEQAYLYLPGRIYV